MIEIAKRRITQHKRFLPYGTHANPALFGLEIMRSLWDNAKASFEYRNLNNTKGLGFFYARAVIAIGRQYKEKKL